MREKVMEILDEISYELNDGIGLPHYKRTFSTEEWNCIHAVMRFVEERLEKCL